jgi:hypothetical protein
MCNKFKITNMKAFLKVWIPITALALASKVALNRHLSKDNPMPLVTGYIQNGSITTCLARTVDCSLLNSGQLCMSSDATPKQVYLKNGLNQCIVELYKQTP